MESANVAYGRYDAAFFDGVSSTARRSAEQIIPALLAITPVTSVLDIGCGVGAWTSAFVDCGVGDVVGVDGDYVDRRSLMIPESCFQAHDLTRPLDLRRRFDVVVCLEVAEHIPPDAAGTLVDSVTAHSDFVLFSAAVPGQGGTHHVNERWPSYWRDLFALHGFEVFDLLRTHFWDDERIGFWYRQNLLLFAKGAPADQLRDSPMLAPPLDIAHPDLISRLVAVPSIRTSRAHLRAAVWRRLAR
jgi:SAM-dependent methyltransferase